MQGRQHVLIAYDIACPRRQHAVRRRVRSQALGGQKSVHDCWLTPAELGRLLAALARCIDPGSDRVLLLSLDGRCQPLHWGRAAPPDPADGFIVS